MSTTVKKTTTKAKAPTTETTTPVVTPAPVVAVVVPVTETAQEVTADKKIKKPRAAAAKTETIVAPVQVVPEPVVPVVVSSSSKDAIEVSSSEPETPVAEQSVEFLAKLQQLGVMISSLKNEYRSLEKKWTRELKVAQKQGCKRKRKAGNRAPSGFVKPTRISDELAIFLEKSAGSEMARTEVTRDINKYIRTNKLQDESNGRKIIPDAKLSALLKLGKDDELTYFNLQRFMSPHFAKASKDAAVAGTV
jgi:chromatin remodeling complex protein RSC6